MTTPNRPTYRDLGMARFTASPRFPLSRPNVWNIYDNETEAWSDWHGSESDAVAYVNRLNSPGESK